MDADDLQLFERTIRACPEQWFQFAPFWPADS